MNKTTKNILTFLVIAITIAVEASVYCLTYNIGIRTFTQEIGYPLAEAGFGVFVLLAMVKQMLFSGRSSKDSVELGDEGFMEKFMSFVITKTLWMIVLIISWLIYQALNIYAV
jgi:hypothetical protein